MAGESGAHAVITDARSATSVEMSSRMRRYAITMAFRTACFVSILLVHGWLRWVLFGAAVFLPYVAVLFANQANQRGQRRREPGAPATAKQLTTGPEEGEVVTGQIVDEPRPYAGLDRDGEAGPRDRVA